ncbi:uncharacterized protein N7496_007930 [Penicillium cataractarum]|uniref:Uncharacterized protein n=1 Tax=Penicillium cataractarum TaxID=2100454 RepID=A0A9W9V6G3_9EURO|nr:uncharacterized protein N7496_007930 [Penicillium cataractarum]KAJ5368170.1 hypothetical protein N7496_007930 [Penicillium cataractarum]
MTTTTDFGPLTTIFSAPTGCATEQWVEREPSSTILRWGAGCNGKQVGWDASCFPSGWTSGNSTKILNKAFNPGYACPSGYVSHANATGTTATKRFPEYIGSIGTDSLAILCCPTGYDWSGEYCSGNQFRLVTRSYLTVESSKCVTTSAPAYNGNHGLNGSVGGATLQGTPIFLIQKIGATEGLSTGAKIAIGVCVPLGIIIIAAVAFIWWHRRRKAQKTQGAYSSVQNAEQNLDPYNGKPELDAGNAVKPYMKQELDAGNQVGAGQPNAPAELPALETPKTPVAELAGGNQSPDTPQAELGGEGTVGGTLPPKRSPDTTSPSGSPRDNSEQRSSSTGRDANN